jgi:hypothetical protein
MNCAGYYLISTENKNSHAGLLAGGAVKITFSKSFSPRLPEEGDSSTEFRAEQGSHGKFSRCEKS